MQYYDINTSPSGRARVLASGRYFLYYEGSAGGADSAMLIRTGNSGTGVILRPGQAYRIPADQRTPDEWNMSPLVAGAQVVGRVVIGDGRIDDGRVSGSVEVINGELSRVKAGVSFFGSAYSINVAAQFSMAQLWNPSGSGRNLVLARITLQESATVAATAHQIRIHNAALLNLSAVQPANKRAGGGASVAQTRQEQAAGVVGSLLGQFPVKSQADAYPWTPTEPIVLPPGFGVVVVPTAVNQDCFPNFEFFEDPV